MKLDRFTIDQLQLFAAVVSEGSFSAAARKLGRTQPAVTYSIQTLEAQLRAELFDRSEYRPKLSEAGRALLPRALRILAEAVDLQVQAQGMASGLEPELTLVVDSMFPMMRLGPTLTEFQTLYPSVNTRIQVETLGAAAEALVEGVADLGVLVIFSSKLDTHLHTEIGHIDLLPVVSPDHPLAREEGILEADTLRRHVQLVLTDRSSLTAGQDFGVTAVRTWRIADLGAKHAMLLAGLGWGSLPAHMVAEDIAAGRLMPLTTRTWDGHSRIPRLAITLARRHDKALGPAGRWLSESLSQTSNGMVYNGKV